MEYCVFFFSSRRRHTRFDCDWSSDVCSSDLADTAVIGFLALDEDGDTFTDDSDKEFIAVGPDYADLGEDLFVVVWHRGNVIYASSSRDGLVWNDDGLGNTGPPVVVSNRTAGSNTAPPRGNAIDSIPAFGPNGEIYVVWEDVRSEERR